MEDFDTEAVAELLFSKSWPPVQRLTRAVWRQFKPAIEEICEASRKIKIQQERERTMLHRKEIMSKLFSEYQKTVNPASWCNMPALPEVLRFEAFSLLYDDPSNRELSRGECMDAIVHLPRYFEELKEEKLRFLLSELPPPDATRSEDSNTLNLLNLATSVFTCISCRLDTGACLFGWDGVNVHAGCLTLAEQGPRNIVVCAYGAKIITALVSFLGFDPAIACQSDMDQRDARLLCACCPAKRYRGVMGRKAYTWREYIRHTVQMSAVDSEHALARWDLLTAETTTLVCLHEEKYPDPNDNIWMCTHCAVHFQTWVLRRIALAHVKEEHAIAVPLEGVDFIPYLGVNALERPRRPFAIAESPLANMRCARCPMMGTRLYSETPLAKHLADKCVSNRD
ncbi:hypothetical protein H0H81_008687 [Sphagnurus paluster]|uniref:Uncharacterized protein n=1 Tax=Sphagnurus paluster TaxID=117069 RepID=A0A9P7FVL3_9AGAR|nr:hypothetical protein H0H81_008687 [Sphagnurus paluster]